MPRLCLLSPLLVGLTLACAGAPTPTTGTPVDEGWVAAAVEEALDWEVMPGTTGDPEPGRAEALRAFFLAHPEYQDPERRAGLADLACAFGTEEAHTRLTQPTPAVPFVVEVTEPSWRLVVIHAGDWCTSDDWAWFTNEIGEALQTHGIQSVYADASHNAVVVQRGGQEAGRYPLEGTGYLALQAGRAPEDTAHDLPESVMSQLNTYFGL